MGYLNEVTKVPMTRILHLTHFKNLPGIIAAGGLWSPNHMPPDVAPSSIAYGHIQSRRANRVVSCGPGGTLADYTPFYFGERSPMLYANHSGHVSSNPIGQRPLVYLVATAEDVHRAGLGWVFTDGHAVIAFTSFFNDLTDLARLDWTTIHARQWADTIQDPDRKRRKQAEFLVHRFFPWRLVRGIVVMDPQMATQVRQILTDAGATTAVHAQPAWYY